MIVAIVGNAAEHGGAVVVAYRENINLAAEIALSSGAQVAVFLIPAVTILSWAIEPLALSFRMVELAALGASVLAVGAVLRDRRSSNWNGAVLILPLRRRRRRVLHRRRLAASRESASGSPRSRRRCRRPSIPRCVTARSTPG